MSEIENIGVNAGVHNKTGMDFQKHCAVFLFLEKYSLLKNARYFIILEHHDDIVFGYLDTDEKLEKIETFQAKKASKEWKVSKLYEIVKKILGNALLLRTDVIEKSNSYLQSQYFITNHTIALKIKEGKDEHGCLVNEANSEINFSILHKKVQANIKQKLQISPFSCSQDEIDEIDNVSFRYIDLSKKSSSQKEQLLGMFHTVFGDKVIDHKAALDTLLYFFNSVESTFNQGNIAKLTDKSKRIESLDINKVVNILTTKKKAYDLWRKKSDEIYEALKIPLLDQSFFKLHFENSFDLFKDLKEIQHQKIFNFVKGKIPEFNKFYKVEDCLGYLLSSFKESNSTQLSDLQMKAAIFAAYFETQESE